MKKWIGPFLSLVLILILVLIIAFNQDSRTATEMKKKAQIVLTQSREGGEKDSFMIDLLRQLKQIVDGWLKSINEEIEDEDVTRFKVRFLEILRSILEWVKEKIDSWLESSEKDMREKGGPLREIHQKRSASSGIG
jgi:septum formation topological specificity factor MinE